VRGFQFSDTIAAVEQLDFFARVTVGFEPDRDRFFQYATFVVLGLTAVVCACYALLFLNPRVNPIAALRPETPTPNLMVAELPPTWTPTLTNTPTNTPTATSTFTPTPLPTDTPPATFTPTFLPTPTIYYLVVTGIPPTRRPPTRVPPPTVPPLPPTPQYAFRLGRPVESAPNCGTWYIAGTVYSDQAGTNRLNGVLVRIWASGIEQGTDTTGTHSNRPGYWEWIFGRGTATTGEVAIVNPDGSLRSPKIPFTLTADCNAPGAIQQNIIDFVGQ
jgi:hypothetical protein